MCMLGKKVGLELRRYIVAVRIRHIVWVRVWLELGLR